MNQQPISEVFNRWWESNHNKSPELIYELFFQKDVKRKGKFLIRMPHSAKANDARCRNFRVYLFKYFNLFIKNTAVSDLKQLPREYDPSKLEDSPLALKNQGDGGLGLGIYAKVNLKEDDVISIEGCCINISKHKHERLVDGGKSNLAKFSKHKIFGKDKNTEAYCTINGAALFLNHACPPHNNAKVSDDWKELTCLSQIDAGNELFLDYGDDFFDEDFPCRNPLCHPV